MKRVVWFYVIACLILCGCGKRNFVTIASSDSTCVMHGKEKERVLKTGKHHDWIFSDSEPGWQATDVRFIADGHQLALPKTITNRLAGLNNASIETKRGSVSDLTIILSGANASGINTLVLEYKNDQLSEARTRAVDDERDVRIYP